MTCFNDPSVVVGEFKAFIFRGANRMDAGSFDEQFKENCVVDPEYVRWMLAVEMQKAIRKQIDKWAFEVVEKARKGDFSNCVEINHGSSGKEV